MYIKICTCICYFIYFIQLVHQTSKGQFFVFFCRGQSLSMPLVHRKCTVNGCPFSRRINNVSLQCLADPIDYSNLPVEMSRRRSTYQTIWRCYLFFSILRPDLFLQHRANLDCQLPEENPQDSTAQNNGPGSELRNMTYSTQALIFLLFFITELLTTCQENVLYFLS